MRGLCASILALLTIAAVGRAADEPASGPVVGEDVGFHMELPAGFRPRHTKAPATGPTSVAVLLLATTERGGTAKNIQILQVQRMAGEGGDPLTEKDLKSFAHGA